jgi:SAM-dependent methyltransferase
MAIYDNDLIANNSFDLNYIPKYLQHAQWAELIELKKAIVEIHLRLQRPIRILDIGVGNARIAMEIADINEIWGCIDYYLGIDNAQNCIEMAAENIKKYGLGNKVKLQLIEAEKLDEIDDKFDIVMTNWFTGGNFYPFSFNLKEIETNWHLFDLNTNDKFDMIMNKGFNLLNKNGELILGALYKQNDATRQKQEKSYLQMGMTIITKPEDTYTATKEGFWSQRFTEAQLYDYLHFANKENIEIIDLDNYDYAMQVRIKK